MADITDRITGPTGRAARGPWRLARIVGDRGFVLLVLTGAMAALLLAGLALRALGEAGATNSYAVLAEAFLGGRLDVARCLDVDCAFHDGRYWVIFPPAPAVLAMPFVAVFGTGFAGFVPLSIAMAGLSLWLWCRILSSVSSDGLDTLWLVLAFAFATPLYYVTIRGDGVWFFAQALAFLMVTVAIHQAVRGGSLVLAGAAIGVAFLSRQMSILYLPFLFALALKPDEPLISLRPAHLRRALALGIPVVAALGVYLAYNDVRFGDPLDTGYAYMMPPAPGETDVMSTRIADHGLFSSAYVLFNAVYLFLQGFHLRFDGADMTVPGGLDPFGTSILAASPFVLLAVFAPTRRPVVIGFLTAAAMIVPMLFYHSNGYTQYNAQRYALDWLPVVFVMLALALRDRRGLLPALQVLVAYAVALNVATMAFLALTAT